MSDGKRMDERLLVPATPALLDGWCGPVGWAADTGCVAHEGMVWDFDPDDPGGTPLEVASAVYLDLARAECRDRVARVVAPIVFDVLDMDVLLTACMVPGRVLGPLVMGMSVTTVHEGSRWRAVEACEDLDPLDDTRLPDGSRLADALALAAVARAVLCG